jgi:hypothetical protein
MKATKRPRLTLRDLEACIFALGYVLAGPYKEELPDDNGTPSRDDLEAAQAKLWDLIELRKAVRP